MQVQCKSMYTVKAVNFSRRSRQSQISRNSAPAAKYCIMSRIAAIFANLGFWSRLRDDGCNTTHFRQPAAKFFSACRAFDVAKLNILNITQLPAISVYGLSDVCCIFCELFSVVLSLYL